MRLKLILKTQPNSLLAYDHHYALRAVIYRILERADPIFSEWLHNQGYTLKGSKRFKLFSFGLLKGQPYLRDDHRKVLKFPTGIVEWEVSFYVDQQVEKFVEGLFKNQVLEVVAGATKVVFQVQNVQILEKPIFHDTMRFRAETGICLTEKTENDRYAQFRSPHDAPFKDLFINSLKSKVEAAHKHDLPPSQSCLRLNGDAPYCDIKLLSEPRKWSAIVPSDEPHGRDIRTIGYRFDFEITAPAEWLRVGYYAGFGGKSSGGFGYCEVLK